MKGLLVTFAVTAIFALACSDGEQPYASESSPSSPTLTETATAAAAPPPPQPSPPADLADRVQACVAGTTSASEAAAALSGCLASNTTQAVAATAEGAADVVVLDVLSVPRCFFTESFLLWEASGGWLAQSLEQLVESPDAGTVFASSSLNWPYGDDVGIKARVVGIFPNIELGIVFLDGGCGSGPQEEFALMTLEGDQWTLRWNGRNTAISDVSHTQVRMIGKGLDALQVTGDSWRMGDTKSQTFHESNPGPHRFFEQTWVRQGFEYIMLAESVTPSAYNTLVEFVYRLSTGDHEGARRLTTDTSLLDTAIQLGLVQDPPGQQWLTNLDTTTVCCGPIYILEGLSQETLVSFTELAGEWLISGIEAADYPGYP